MATVSELKDVNIDFIYSTITKEYRFLSVFGNRASFSNEQNAKWVFEKEEDDDIYYIRNLHAGKNEPKYLGSANANNILFLYVSKCKFTRWSIIQDEDTLYSIRYCGETGDPSLHTIVISRYKEDLEWIEPYCDEVIVYNKGPIIHNSVFNEIRNIDNVGREGHTYLHHILVDYHKISDRVTFLQGESLSHNDTLLFGIENSEKLLPTQSLSYRYLEKYNVPPEDYLHRIKVVTDFGLEYTEQAITKNCYVEYFDKGILSLINRYRRKYNIQKNTNVCQHFLSMCGIHDVIVPEYFEFWQSALFSVSREDIFHNPPDTYMKLIHGLLRVHPQGGDEGYILERLWKLIFNFEYVINGGNQFIDSKIRANSRLKSGFFRSNRNILPVSVNNLEDQDHEQEKVGINGEITIPRNKIIYPDSSRVHNSPNQENNQLHLVKLNKIFKDDILKVHNIQNKTHEVVTHDNLHHRPQIILTKILKNDNIIVSPPVINEGKFIQATPNIRKVFKSDFVKIHAPKPFDVTKHLKNTIDNGGIKSSIKNRFVKVHKNIAELQNKPVKIQPSFFINKQILLRNHVTRQPAPIVNPIIPEPLRIDNPNPLLVIKHQTRRNRGIINIPPSIPVRIPLHISPLFIFTKKYRVLNTGDEKVPTVKKQTKALQQPVNIRNIRVSNSQGFVSDIFDNDITLPLVHENRVALILRGHIRSGFDNDKLYTFVKSLCDLYDVDIYIHTWHILQNSISYRKMKQINTVVTSASITEYFKDIPIKKIIIENDLKIKLIGDLSGKICKTNVPTIGWKNMWYGINRIVNQVPNDVYSSVIQTRFDYFNLTKILTKPMPEALQTVDTSLNSEKLVFAINSESVGVDNFYCGNIILMKQLVNEFNTNLDEICLKYPEARTQEKLVWYIYHDLINTPFTPTLDIIKVKKISNFFRR
jgi:hypothetical protein